MSKTSSNTNEFLKLRKKAEEKLIENKKNAKKHSLADLEHGLNVHEIGNKKNAKKHSLADLEHGLSVHEIELQMQNEELIATQLKLKAAVKEYSELFELSPTGYFILDKHGIIEKVNQRGCELVGMEQCNLIGKPFNLFLNGELQQDNFYRYRNDVLQYEKIQQIECEVRKKDGTVFSALIKSTPVKDEENHFKHFLSIVSDISKIKEHERQITIALEKAEELNEMKSRFISMASHEFRTPLAAILSGTWLVEKYAEIGEAEKMKNHLSRIRSSVKDLTLILEEFLSHEKLETGKVEVTRKLFNVPELCSNIIEDIQSLLKKGQHINYEHIGEESVTADREIVNRILQNLLSNACKYSEDGRDIQLTTEVTKRKVLISVKDNGIGIPKTDQQYLFTRFFRARNAVNIQGTGLGLNIVKRYVEIINGTISFQSEENVGSLFQIAFPRSSR